MKSQVAGSGSERVLENGGGFCKNIVGPQIRKLRWERGLRQRDLAARLQIAGWNVDRAAVSKIESRLRCVADRELFLLAQALGVEVVDLFPKIENSNVRGSG